ncbi:hypothetical protein OCU04_008052 [Sclerotinia nivalis]|uniref:Uncharacterized protein n=1 Tax=Sclerotinia nivalis TaxID=352851 RepID=A0A9X0DH88_9HELO|nr:hypothetical protein OCU04_008052 [Sclerotinia nivalis]
MDADAIEALLSPRGRSPIKRKRVSLHTAQADEDDNPASKRRCINSSSFSTSTTEDDTNPSPTPLYGSPPTLEDNLGLQKENQVRKSSFVQEFEHFDQLREQCLRKQRPAGFVPITFENARTVREKLESVGVEFIDDSSEEADDLNNVCN